MDLPCVKLIDWDAFCGLYYFYRISHLDSLFSFLIVN